MNSAKYIEIFKSGQKEGIRADCIEVDSFSYDIINEFLEYLEKRERRIHIYQK